MSAWRLGFRVLGVQGLGGLGFRVYFRWTPHPVIVTTRENKASVRVRLCSYYTTFTAKAYRAKSLNFGVFIVVFSV